MTDKSAAAIREFAEKWCLKVIEVMKGDDYIMHDLDGCLSDLTALISEHYVPKDDYDKLGRLMDQLAEADEKQTSELLRQRDELREALQSLMGGVRGLPPLTAIAGTLEKQYKQAEAAIKSTER